MSSTTRLLILGVVRIFQPVHGYEIRRELKSWQAEDWASVKPGSIYNALKTLTAEGLLEVVGVDQVGGRPERTTYQLTVPGEEEFRGLLRHAWWDVKHVTDPLMAGVSFLGLTPRSEAIAALEERITKIRSQLRFSELMIEQHDPRESPEHVREMMRLMAARMSSEIAWAEALIARLKAGEYATLGDPKWAPARAQEMIESRDRERARRVPKTAVEAVGGERKRRVVSARRTKRG